jgi:hypothetical protein
VLAATVDPALVPGAHAIAAHAHTLALPSILSNRFVETGSYGRITRRRIPMSGIRRRGIGDPV